MSDLVEGERQIVFPGGGRDDQPEDAVRIGDVAGVQLDCAKAAQEILELVDRLDRRRRIVDRRRKRLDGDVDKKSDWVFRVLLEGAFAPEADGAEERVLRQGRCRLMNPQKDDALYEGVADRAGHHDRPACLSRQRDEGADVEAGNSAWLAGILQRLGRVAEPRPARCGVAIALYGGRTAKRPEHLADHGAPAVADQMENIADLKVAKALHQPSKHQHADDDHDPDERRRERRGPAPSRRGPPKPA